MSELKDLYQEVIFDHNKHPNNFGILVDADHDAEGHNPLCGDKIHIYLNMNGDMISEVKFDGSGCAISRASASIMTSVLIGKTIEEANKMFDDFHILLTNDHVEDEMLTKLGKLAVFDGVKEFPTRIKCASLAWHTLRSALNNEHDIATTE